MTGDDGNTLRPNRPGRGFEVGDEFLLGYGMDWQGRYRNVPSIWAVMDLSVLTADPESFGRHAFQQIQGSAG